MKNLTLVLATLAIIPMTAFSKTTVKSDTLVECGIFTNEGKFTVLVPEGYTVTENPNYKGLIFLQTQPDETDYITSLQKTLIKNGYKPFQEGVNYCIVTNTKNNKTVAVYQY